jgi:hypothetical protein
MSAVDSFCEPLLPRLPKKTCVDAAGYRPRSKKEYEKQSKECSSEHKRKETCPNDPSKCKSQEFSFEEYCGVFDQSCRTDDDCLGWCYGDCFPCNTRDNCDILESFGVIAPEGTPCFSPFNHSAGLSEIASRAVREHLQRMPSRIGGQVDRVVGYREKE